MVAPDRDAAAAARRDLGRGLIDRSWHIVRGRTAGDAATGHVDGRAGRSELGAIRGRRPARAGDQCNLAVKGFHRRPAVSAGPRPMSVHENMAIMVTAARARRPRPALRSGGRIAARSVALVSHYRILSHVGTGGMGSGLSGGGDVSGQRRVALKFLAPSTVSSSEASARLIREARAASVLPDHPHIRHDLRNRRGGRRTVYRDGVL